MFALFLLVAGTHLAALLSPGPDFFLLLRALLLRGQRHADGCAAGIALANLLSMLLVLLLLGLVATADKAWWLGLQALGGGYFLWLGGQALLARRRLELPEQALERRGQWRHGLIEGVIASSLNPKLPIFYAGLFGVLREAAMPVWGMVASVVWMTLVVLVWDMMLVRLLGHARWRGWLQLRISLLDRLCGALLAALGLWLLAGVGSW